MTKHTPALLLPAPPGQTGLLPRLYTQIKHIGLVRLLGLAALYAALFFALTGGLGTAKKVAEYYPAASLRYNTPLSGTAAAQARRWAAANPQAAFWPSYWAQQTASVQGSTRKTTARCIWYSGQGSLVWPARFINGGYPGAEDAYGAAISAKTAWELWGSTDVIGQTVEINGVTFTIRGVFEGEEALLLGALPDNAPPQGWQGVELSPNSEFTGMGNTTDLADSFARASGLGTPDALVNGETLTGLAKLTSRLPLIVFLAGGLALLLGSTSIFKQKGRRELVFFALLLGFALLLPTLIELLPSTLIPSRWSDFSFWSTLVSNWKTQLRDYLSILPLWKDTNARMLMLLLLMQAFAALFLIPFVLRRTIKTS